MCTNPTFEAVSEARPQRVGMVLWEISREFSRSGHTDDHNVRNSAGDSVPQSAAAKKFRARPARLDLVHGRGSATS